MSLREWHTFHLLLPTILFLARMNSSTSIYLSPFLSLLSFPLFLPPSLTSSLSSDLINENIENAVAKMQAIIELGRYIRDVKVLPTKVNNGHISCIFR